MSLDQVLARLSAALVDAGLPLWRAPVSMDAIEALEIEIAPLRLPAELRQLWARVDPRTLRVLPYQSHECMAVELDVGDVGGRRAVRVLHLCRRRVHAPL